MTNTSRILATLSVCAAAAMIAATLSTQSSQAAPKSIAVIQTDLSDYPPGTQVNVTGSGWLASEVVELMFTETATTPPGGFTDGPFVFYATADDLGNIVNGEFYTDQHDLGVSFHLTGKGAISGRTAQTTFTDSLAGLFQIDGDAAGGTAMSHDWDQVYADYLVRIGQAAGTGLTSGTGSIQFTTDGVTNAQDDAFANSPKDTQDISSWKWTRKAISSSKTDLEHGFAAAYQDTGYAATYGTTHTVLFVGTDRYASGSNSAISMWFLQHPIGAKADGTFCSRTGPVCKATDGLETHTDGDLLIQADLGNPPGITAYQWKAGALQPISLSATQYKAFINSASITVPWTFIDNNGSTKPQAQEFFEVGLDLNEVFKASSDNLPDFSSFIITSRTSNSQTATLADFILGNISSVPDIAVDKVADAATVSAGGQVGYKVTVRNVGVGDVTGATLSDPLPAGAGTDLNWTLAADSTSGVFQVTGAAGSQILSFISGSQILPNNSAPLVAHVVATSKSDDLGKLHNVATVTGAGEPVDFQSNNAASADIVVVPTAVNDSYSTPLNIPLNVAVNGVLSNDGTPLAGITSVLVSNTGHGTVSLGSAGSFTYTPASNFSGIDTFTYQDKDASGNLSNVATVTITVNAATLTVTKVVNTTAWGGSATASDFSLAVGSTPVASGASTAFAPGTYTVSESGGPSGYTQTSIVCDGSGNNSVTLAAGNQKSCTVTNTSLAAHLTLKMDVTNNNGGALTASDFNVSWTGPTAHPALDLHAGSYTLVAPDKNGYTTGTWSCTGATLSAGAVTLIPGQSATCTITYDDIAAKLTVVKSVLSEHGGNAQPNDFKPSVDGTVVVSGAKNTYTANTALTINETQLTGYQFVSLAGNKCPAALGGTVTLAPGDDITCTITNVDIAPKLTVVKNVLSEHGGNAQPNDFKPTVGGTVVVSGAKIAYTANTALTINETQLTGYQFVSLTGNKCPAALGGTVTLAPGDDITCTITNVDIAPKLTVIKTVLSEHGGNAQPNDFRPSVGGTVVVSGAKIAYTANTALAINETQLTGYQFVSLTGNKCPAALGGTVTLAPGDDIACTITNVDQPAQLTVSTQVIGGPNTASEFSMYVTGGNANPTPFAGLGAGVVVDNLNAASYVVNQGNTPVGYTLTSGCSKTLVNGEQASCTVVYSYAKARLAVSSAMSWVLHDSLKVEGLRTGAPTAPDSAIVFKLYGPSVEKSCADANLIYQETLTGVTGDATFPTVAGFKVTDAGTYRWVVSYSGDDFNEAASTTCGDETHTITVGEPTPQQ